MDLALFDFDGTITRQQTMPEFMRRTVSRSRYLLGWLLLGPRLAACKLGLDSPSGLRSAMIRLGYRQQSLTALRSAGQAFAMDYLPGVLLPQAMQRIAWHRERGDRVVVVSGGLDVYLQPWCEQHGLELLCSQLEHSGDVLSGRYLGAQCVQAEKARLVQHHYALDRFNTIWAYGDTPEDRELLAMAQHRCYRWQEGQMPP